MDNIKTCISCGTSKSLSEYGIRSDTKKAHNRCKSCISEKGKKNRLKNIVAVRAQAKIKYLATRERCCAKAKENRLKDPVAYAARRRLRIYKITTVAYEKLMKLQNNSCAICRRAFGEARETGPHIDHNHINGKVRGLLCGKCNTGLGLYKDSATNLRMAAEYLDEHNGHG